MAITNRERIAKALDQLKEASLPSASAKSIRR
jgi:hypothetical protein